MRWLHVLAIVVMTSCITAAVWAKAPLPRPVFDLPKNAIAFHFGGGRPFPNFKTVRESTVYEEAAGFGFVATPEELDASISNGGNSRQWPFGLVGNYLSTNPRMEKELTFRAKAPNGDYNVWLLGGRLIRPDIRKPRYLLKVNETVVFDEDLSPREFNDEKHLFRFLWTQYSEKPHALWDNYISVMYPMSTHTVKVTDGHVTMRLQNVLLAAMILLPANQKAEFEKMVTTLRDGCRDDYESTVRLPEQTKPARGPAEGDFLLYVPRWGDTVMPNWEPPVKDRKRVKVQAAGAPGQPSGRECLTRRGTPPRRGAGRSPSISRN